MLEAVGTVVGVDGECVLVRAQRPASCAACPPGGACAGVQCRSGPTLRIANSLGVRTGDRVVFAIADGSLVRAAWHAYLLPLAAGIVAALAAAAAVPAASDLAAFAGFCLGLGAGLAAARKSAGRAAPLRSAAAILVKRLPGAA